MIAGGRLSTQFSSVSFEVGSFGLVTAFHIFLLFCLLFCPGQCYFTFSYNFPDVMHRIFCFLSDSAPKENFTFYVLPLPPFFVSWHQSVRLHKKIYILSPGKYCNKSTTVASVGKSKQIVSSGMRKRIDNRLSKITPVISLILSNYSEILLYF